MSPGEHPSPRVVIVGHLVPAEARDGAVAAHADLVRGARTHDGCVHLAITADQVDPRRVNNVEVWRDAVVPER